MSGKGDRVPAQASVDRRPSPSRRDDQVVAAPREDLLYSGVEDDRVGPIRPVDPVIACTGVEQSRAGTPRPVGPESVIAPLTEQLFDPRAAGPASVRVEEVGAVASEDRGNGTPEAVQMVRPALSEDLVSDPAQVPDPVVATPAEDLVGVARGNRRTGEDDVVSVGCLDVVVAGPAPHLVEVARRVQDYPVVPRPCVGKGATLAGSDRLAARTGADRAVRLSDHRRSLARDPDDVAVADPDPGAILGDDPVDLLAEAGPRRGIGGRHAGQHGHQQCGRKQQEGQRPASGRVGQAWLGGSPECHFRVALGVKRSC